MWACWIKAVLLELAVVLSVLGGLVTLILAIGGTGLLVNKLSHSLLGSTVARKLRTAGNIAFWSLVCLVSLVGVIAVTTHAKNSVCSRGFNGAWRQVWAAESK